MRKSYSDQEFPVRLSAVKKKKDYDSASIPASLREDWNHIDDDRDTLLHYEINNKTATNLGVMAYRRNGNRALPYFAEVEPLSKGILVIPVSGKNDPENVQVEFLIRMNDEWLERIVHTLNAEQVKKKSEGSAHGTATEKTVK